MRCVHRHLLLATALLATAAIAGCGSGRSTTDSTNAKAAKPARAALAARRDSEAEAPEGASPTLRAIYAAFPAPRPNPDVKRSGAAIRAGIAACKGKSPTGVKDEFYGAAKPNLAPQQRKLISHVASFERHISTDAGFISGQLAADVYGATLLPRLSQYGYQGCVYSLARRLERRLAPRR